MKKLTAIQVAKIKKPGRYSIGDGAYLQITGERGRSWIFRYERDGRAHHVGLGSCKYVTLAEARAKAYAMQRGLILDGVDPLEARRTAARERQLANATAKTFREVALDFIAAHESSWRGDHSRKQWVSSLERYVFPKIGNLRVATVGVTDVLATLDPIAKSIPETAARLQNRIAKILDWAAARELRSHDNPARRRELLPARKRGAKQHFPALPYQEIGSFMQDLRQRSEIGAKALELLILTATRPGEVLGARWEEIEGDIWTISAARTKVNRAHRIPLSRSAVNLLGGLPRTDALVFGQHSPQLLARTLARMQVSATAHGFRSTFRDWAAETTAYPNYVVEQALAHSIGSVEAAYRRGDLFEKRRRLMADWADYLGRPTIKAAVVPLRREM
jgi:integrase